MALKKQMCVSHPERPAIGVCVITQQPICAECSTRYEGVNYSKEGLRLLHERRAAAARRAGAGRGWLAALALLGCPLLFYLMYLYYYTLFAALIDLQQIDWRTSF